MADLHSNCRTVMDERGNPTQCPIIMWRVKDSLSINLALRVSLHVKASRNEITDGLVLKGSHKDFTYVWLSYFFRNCYTSQTRYQFFLEAGPVREWYERTHPWVALHGRCSKRDQTIFLLGFAVDILELNGKWRVCKFALLVRLAIRPKPLLSTSCLVLIFDKSQLLLSPAIVLQCLKTHGFMDLI
ncbi:hypothetical protein TNCV_2478431 [Trichonephila clavipes]|nr:hypothetical protein TNCV_2478431 [Trichonephila clavipes]